MYHAARSEELLPEREMTTRQGVFLVIYVFTGLMLVLTAISALATSPQYPITSAFANPLETTAGIADVQKETVK